MTTNDNRIFEKLEGLERSLNNFKVEIAKYMGEISVNKKKWDKTHEVIFGNGNNMGLKAKIAIIWGGLGLAWTLIVAIGTMVIKG